MSSQAISETMHNAVWIKYSKGARESLICWCCNSQEVTKDTYKSARFSPSTEGNISLGNLRPVCEACFSTLDGKSIKEFRRTQEKKPKKFKGQRLSKLDKLKHDLEVTQQKKQDLEKKEERLKEKIATCEKKLQSRITKAQALQLSFFLPNEKHDALALLSPSQVYNFVKTSLSQEQFNNYIAQGRSNRYLIIIEHQNSKHAIFTNDKSEYSGNSVSCPHPQCDDKCISIDVRESLLFRE